MSDEVLFLDTNVLVYVFDADEPEKQALARQLLRENPEIRLSSQVLSEFYVTVTRKLARPLVPAQALQVVNEWRRFQVTAITPQLVTKGISRSIDSRISFCGSARRDDQKPDCNPNPESAFDSHVTPRGSAAPTPHCRSRR